MRPRLEPGDRKLLMIAAALLAAVSAVGVLVSPPAGQREGVASSYSAASGGAKAAYDLLAASGYRVERWSKPPGELPAVADHTVLILADPLVKATSEDAASVRGFLMRGGRVLATGTGGAALLFQNGLVPASAGETGTAWERFPAEQPAALVAGAPEILMKSASRWPPLVGAQQRYYGDVQGAVVVAYAAGPGHVVWWASSAPLTNYGLTQASNLTLLLNSVGAERSQVRVLWDEYFHGQQAGFWAYEARTPLPWGLAQLALLAVAVLFTYGGRSGPVRPLVTSGSRLSPLEFVETVGDLYERKGAAAGALEIAYERFRSVATRRLGLSHKATAADLCRGARQCLGWNVPGLWETLDRSERDAGKTALSDAQALRLIRELHDYGRRLRFALYQ